MTPPMPPDAEMSLMRCLRQLVLSVGLALGLVAGVALPAAAVVPPFPQPSEWATICDTKRPAGTNLARGTNCRWIPVDGHPRRYLVYVPQNPTYSLGRRWPVVFMYHGSSGDGEQFWRNSGWRALAEQQGFIVVFPTGLRYDLLDGPRITKWTDFGLAADVDLTVRLDGYPATAPMPADDVKFTLRMLADISTQLFVAPRRFHLAGFSNGAGMAARVAVQRPGVFASAAITGGGLSDVYDPSRNPSLLFGVGTLDDRFLEVINRVAEPDLTEIPLSWADVETVLPGFLANHRDTFGMDPADVDVVEGATSTRATWDLPLGGEDDDQVVRFVLMEDLAHKYPTAPNNPNGFRFALMSWAWFDAHRLP